MHVVIRLRWVHRGKQSRQHLFVRGLEQGQTLARCGLADRRRQFLEAGEEVGLLAHEVVLHVVATLAHLRASGPERRCGLREAGGERGRGFGGRGAGVHVRRAGNSSRALAPCGGGVRRGGRCGGRGTGSGVCVALGCASRRVALRLGCHCLRLLGHGCAVLDRSLQGCRVGLLGLVHGDAHVSCFRRSRRALVTRRQQRAQRLRRGKETPVDGPELGDLVHVLDGVQGGAPGEGSLQLVVDQVVLHDTVRVDHNDEMTKEPGELVHLVERGKGSLAVGEGVNLGQNGLRAGMAGGHLAAHRPVLHAPHAERRWPGHHRGLGQVRHERAAGHLEARGRKHAVDVRSDGAAQREAPGLVHHLEPAAVAGSRGEPQEHRGCSTHLGRRPFCGAGGPAAFHQGFDPVEQGLGLRAEGLLGGGRRLEQDAGKNAGRFTERHEQVARRAPVRLGGPLGQQLFVRRELLQGGRGPADAAERDGGAGGVGVVDALHSKLARDGRRRAREEVAIVQAGHGHRQMGARRHGLRGADPHDARALRW
mmetsp:Transcript_10717/g.41609  ORF Transcript_10717/g.41609 Transcript_10717/m.41609 type:complete len:536 (-) Transcript_10717:15-1622(-)